MGLHTVWTDDGKWSVVLDLRATNGYNDYFEDLIDQLSPYERRALAAQLKNDIDRTVTG